MVWGVRIQSTLLVAGGYLLPDLTLVEPLPRTQQPTSPLARIYEDVVAYVDGQSVRPILADAPPVPVSELLG